MIEIVKQNEPITSEQIAHQLKLSRATIRPDLSILTMAGYLEARPRVGYFFTGKTGSELLAKRLMKYKIKEFQSVPVVVKESASVYDAISMMFLNDVGTLFVINNEKCLSGVLSRKDLFRACIGNLVLNYFTVHFIITCMLYIRL